MKISIVIPVYNAEATIGPLAERIIRDLYPGRLQLVLVNDGSRDGSDRVCRELVNKHPQLVTYLCLTRNFGEHNAVLAGLNHATGDYIVIMDDDFQNPPEEVSTLIEACRGGGHDVVYGVYRKKEHHPLRNLGSWFTNRVATLLIRKPADLYLSSFKCLTRFVAGEVVRYTGPYPYLDGLIFQVTDRVAEVPVQHVPRREGSSNYTLRKLVRLWLHMFVNFSVMPLRASMLLGFILTMVGLLLMTYFVAGVWFNIGGPWPPGWPSLYVSITIFSGTQLLTLGLIGEYLGRLFLLSNRLPQFVVRPDREEEKP